ncbi:hypothetical protein GGD81_004632 [Rhodobium orientis]|uniref:Uncharacterized protein n=1 Tax=Rhodobium orientis TaxID=34017 RepID=A0A327JEC5_9HYPH|nr:hypothetical protein [Rhodobium orientis]MBB4305552.1 hypothetical protein [Rhodobium orientis]MBK5949147.1 hypothetical protein [Rhodobium orientis]RAI24689.1 hypothetical protein CH339_21700 [Rhodobium orientis]
MLRKTAIVAMILTGTALPALAGQMPDFLAKKYATDAAACKGQEAQEESGALVLDKTGIFGTEFGCSYRDFWGGKDGTVTVLVSCSDDSGVTRPDLLSVIREQNGELRVQSQNEFVMGEVALSLTPVPETDGQQTDEPAEDVVPNFEYVTGTYTPCDAAAKAQ